MFELGSGSKVGDESLRRHSSDMEMDDGEDDLDNYQLVAPEGYFILFLIILILDIK